MVTNMELGIDILTVKTYDSNKKYKFSDNQIKKKKKTNKQVDQIYEWIFFFPLI